MSRKPGQPGFLRLRVGSRRLARLAARSWAAAGALTAYGLRVGLRSNEPAGYEALLEWAPRVLRPSSSSAVVDRLYSLVLGGGPGEGRSRYHRVYDGGARVARGTDLELTLDAFRNEIELFLAEHARGRVFVHAAALGWKGRAVLIPAQS